MMKHWLQGCLGSIEQANLVDRYGTMMDDARSQNYADIGMPSQEGYFGAAWTYSEARSVDLRVGSHLTQALATVARLQRSWPSMPQYTAKGSNKQMGCSVLSALESLKGRRRSDLES